MTPATTVSSVTHDARLNGERIIAPVVVSDYPQTRPYHEVPVMPHADPRNAQDLLNDDSVKKLRQQNTTQLLKSNYWFEIANISRWCTTGLIGLTGLTVLSTAGWSASALPTTFAAITAGLGTALATAPVWACFAALGAAALFTVKASQHSRRVFVEKSFDVQDTLMQRQAQLVGQSVEQAVDQHVESKNHTQWAARTRASLDQAATTEAAR